MWILVMAAALAGNPSPGDVEYVRVVRFEEVVYPNFLVECEVFNFDGTRQASQFRIRTLNCQGLELIVPGQWVRLERDVNQLYFHRISVIFEDLDLAASVGRWLAEGGASVPPLVTNLGSSRYHERQVAEKLLGEKGESALDEIGFGLASKDPEIRRRAERLLNRLRCLRINRWKLGREP